METIEGGEIFGYITMGYDVRYNVISPSVGLDA